MGGAFRPRGGYPQVVTVGVSSEWSTIQGAGVESGVRCDTPEPGRAQFFQALAESSVSDDAQPRRQRFFQALAELIAERGYRDVSSTDIAARVGITTEQFFRHFPDKEQCFIAAYDEAIDEAMQRVYAAAATGKPWPERVQACLAAFLAYVADNPTLARMCLVETVGAGPGTVTRYEDTIARFIPLLRLGREQSEFGSRLPETMEETMVGGLFWLLHDKIINREVERIEALLPELTQFVLTPYLGSERAKQLAVAVAA